MAERDGVLTWCVGVSGRRQAGDSSSSTADWLIVDSVRPGRAESTPGGTPASDVLARVDGAPRRGARSRSGALLRACHPEPAAAVVVGSCVLAVAVGRDALGVLEVGAAVAATQLAVGWSNDWLDADRDRRVGRADKPIPAGAVSRRTVGLCAILAAVASAPLAALSGWRACAVLMTALIAALLYNWPLKFTAASALPYLVAFACLAAFVPLSRPGAPTPPWWLVVAGGLLGGGAHFVNVLPDLDDDLRTGIRGLPHRIGRGPSIVAAACGLLSATGLLAFGPPRQTLWLAWPVFAAAAAVLACGLMRGRRPGSRAAFRAVLLVALADVTLLVVSGARL